MILALGLNAVHEVNTSRQSIELKEIKIRNIEAELTELESDYIDLQKNKTNTLEQKNKEIEDLKQRENELESQIEARRQVKEQQAKAYAIEQSRASELARNTADCNTGNKYKDFIYYKESGCRTNAINPNGGACGIGQALPCSKLPCSLSDYACQDSWFSNYAIKRYGSWENAYNFWTVNSWW